MDDCDKKKTMRMVNDQGVGRESHTGCVSAYSQELILHVANLQHSRYPANHNQSRSLLGWNECIGFECRMLI
jgi:hypothetical protein